jgi:uncharacterized protein (DUF58 family)
MELLSAILGAIILYLIQMYLYNKYWCRNLSVDIAFSKGYAVEDDDMTIKETIVNDKLLPIPILKMKFVISSRLQFSDTDNAAVSDNYYRNDMVSIMMHQKLIRTLTFRCKKRGYYKINRMEVIGSNLFLSNENILVYKVNTDLYVYPRPINDIRFEAAFQKMLGTVLTKRFINEDPFEFRNIREYQSYDNLKTINWKASAKTGSLMVNVHDYTSSQQVKIFLNTQSQTLIDYNVLKEEGIRIASALAIIFINQGIPVSFDTNARDMLTKEPVKVLLDCGNNQIKTIQEALSRIDLIQEPENFMTIFNEEFLKAADHDYIIIISTYHRSDFQHFLLSQLKSKTEYIWVIPFNHETKLQVEDGLISKSMPMEFI